MIIKKISAVLITILIAFSLISCNREPYTVNWIDNEGNILGTQTVEPGDEVQQPSAPYIYGYRFNEWVKSESIENNLVIYTASYSINEYKVVFKDDLGRIIEIQVVKHGSNATNPKTPTKISHEFLGWDKPITNIVQDTTISAIFLKTYTKNEIYNIVKDSVFKVEILDKNQNIMSQGSGFFIKEDGTFITNAHVVEDGWYGRIDQDSNIFDIEISEIVKYESNYDYAILKVKNYANATKYKPVTFSNTYEVGDIIYSIGYPQNSYTSIISTGEILGNKMNLGIPYILTNATLNSGSSGGITVNRFGEVIGITTYAFGDNTFGSIPVRIFENSLNTFNLFPKSIKDYFHPTQSVFLTSTNFSSYFDLSVENTDVEYYSSYASIDFEISIKPSQELEFPSFSYIYITLMIEINYSYYSYLYNNVYTYSSTHTKYEYITLYNTSKYEYTGNLSTSIFNSNLKSLNTYNYSIFSVSGTIKIYIWFLKLMLKK